MSQEADVGVFAIVYDVRLVDPYTAKVDGAKLPIRRPAISMDCENICCISFVCDPYFCKSVNEYIEKCNEEDDCDFCEDEKCYDQKVCCWICDRLFECLADSEKCYRAVVEEYYGVDWGAFLVAVKLLQERRGWR